MTMRRTAASALVIALTVLVASCATGRAFSRGEEAGKAGDWEAAVGFYRQALQDNPDRPEYKIALERAMVQASAMFTEQGRQFEAAGQPEEALRAYRKAQEFEPSNRQLAARAGELERQIRDKMEATAARPEIDKLREQARRSTTEPLLNPASRDLLGVHFTNAGIRDVLNFIGASTGINVTYDRDFQDRSITVNLEGVTLEQALQQIMVANVLFYKVLNERTIIVAADTTQKRTQYEEQVIRTFFISHSDATELSQLLTGVVRVAGMAIQPTIVANKTSNTVTVRATAPVVQIIERIIDANDKPRAEIMVDVQILEVSRERAKHYGLNLSSYSISTSFSPEAAPSADSKPFNVNTISKGVSTADFYMALPTAVVNFLESDSQTKVLAKPNIRATEGQKVALNLGEDVPVPSTTFTPIATGGPTTNPLVSYGYRTIGIIVEMEPRVTYEGDIILNISVENSARGSDSNIAGQNLPSFFSRKVQTRLRLRDGESNLLAGLLRDDERRSLNGFPGVMRLPIVKQLFSNNDNQIKQTDIVMLITPRIIRTHELKALDLSPIYIGTQANMALGGPPPLIGGADAAAAPPQGAAGAPAAVPTGTTPRPAAPAVTAPVPGVMPPTQPTQPPAAAPSPITVFPPEPPAAPAAPAPTVPAPAAPQPAAPTAPAAQPPAPASPAPIVGTARVTLSPPSEMRVGSGPYTVPVSVTGASRMSTITMSVTYNPALVRVRSVQEGTFMRQGGATPAFTTQTDEKGGRVDIAVTRPGDQTGASASGLIAAILFEAIAPGTGTLTITGTATIPGGTPAGLQFAPATITVK
jgi:general secretion pathway protein D